MFYKIILITFLASACSFPAKRTVKSSQDIYEMGSQDGVEMLEMTKMIFTFEPNSSELKTEDKKQLDALITEILGNQKKYRRIEIVGHSDQTGTDDRNLDVSKARALLIRTSMKEAGVRQKKIST